MSPPEVLLLVRIRSSLPRKVGEPRVEVYNVLAPLRTDQG